MALAQYIMYDYISLFTEFTDASKWMNESAMI